MKKLLLLSALLIFACSSDDSSDSDDNDLMEETFLERYDSVVWENTGFDGDDNIPYVSGIVFSNNPPSFNEYYEEFPEDNIQPECFQYYFDEEFTDVDGDVIFLRIIENLGNSFIFEGDGLQTIITANDVGNSISISNGGTAYRTNSENPCE